MKLSPLIKKQIIDRVIKEKESISLLSRQYGVARKTIYSWIDKYQNASPRNKIDALKPHYLTGSKHPRAKYPKAISLINRWAVVHPRWGCRKISQGLKEKGIKLSYFSVNQVLKKIGAENYDRRINYARNYSGPGRPKEDIKLEIVNRVLQEHQPILVVANNYKISRKTIYQWIKKYQQTGNIRDNYVRAETHPRAIYPKLSNNILSIVAKNPQYSVHKIAKMVPASTYTIWKILDNYNLRTIAQRTSYSQYQTTPKPLLTPQIVNRVKSVFETFTPNLAPAPPPSFLGLVKIFLVSLSSSLVLALLTLFWIKIYNQAPAENKIGLIFASIALAAGSFFFLYSLKYYLTLALVLGFSRHAGDSGGVGGSGGSGEDGNGGENGNHQGNHSWLARLLGLNGTNGKGYNGLPAEALAKAGGLQPNLDHIKLSRFPFVSIHLPVYNERKVVNRLLDACTSMDYPSRHSTELSRSPSSGQVNYEVVVVDDSTDETTQILNDWKNHPRVKIIHRETREGFKGGALKVALENSDPRTEFVLVFDADFVPYPDTITQFLKYFQSVAGTLEFGVADFNLRPLEARNELRYSSKIAAIQGYQWHVLNKSENWITRGVRSEYAGSYVVERSGEEVYGGLKQIAGSVYMIRKDVLDKFGWQTSITEDFQLTLRLYEQGYKVVYTPYVQGPAECVSTIKRLVRQRMRWAEGHSCNVKRMFTRLLLGRWISQDEVELNKETYATRNIKHVTKTNVACSMLHVQATSPQMVWIPSPLTLVEKLEFLYLSPYYLQAFFFLIGTFSWLLAETVFKARLPFWTALWGWSLVLTNMAALPLLNTVGLFLEESEEKDYLGSLSFVAISYLLVPFQAYASIKGFLEKEEGPWFRTPKTGKITDIFARGTFYRWLSGIIPGIKPALNMEHGTWNMEHLRSTNSQFPISISNPSNPYLGLATANNTFNKFNIVSRKRRRWVGKGVVSIILIFALFLNALTFNQGFSLFFHSAIDKVERNLNIEAKEVFAVSEVPEFTLKFPEVKEKSWFNKMFSQSEARAAEPQITSQLLDFNGQEVKGITPELKDEKGQKKILLSSTNGLKPGKYTLKVKAKNQEGEYFESRQDFRWGVLAINTNKSIYTPGEVAKLGFGAVDDRGHTICDASLKLKVQNSKLKIEEELSTENGKIKQSGECSQQSVTNVADYIAEFKTEAPGIYILNLTAKTANGERTIEDKLEVKEREDIPFDIERTSYPTRIYPPAEYPITLTVKANKDFKGEVEERVPKEFEVKSEKLKIKNETGKFKVLEEEIEWKKGETHTLEYTIKFPPDSPQFYLIGPLRFIDTHSGQAIFSEARQWQIAADLFGTVFMETPDATNYTTGDTGTQFWGSVTGTVSYDTSQKKSGRGSWKANSGAGNAAAYLYKTVNPNSTNTLSVWVMFSAFPSSGDVTIMRSTDNSVPTNDVTVRISSTGVLKLWDEKNNVQVGSNGSTLVTGTWYRLSWAINNSSPQTWKLFLNGNLDASGSVSLVRTVSQLVIGWVTAPGANIILYFQNVYARDAFSLIDTGDVRITAKLPSAVNNNNFDATGGTGAVNERPINENNYRQDATADNPGALQDYTLETASGGDVNISGNTLVSYGAWVWAKRGSGSVTTNASIISNGAETSITLTTTPTLFAAFTDGTAYPTNAQGIGMRAINGGADTFFYEGDTLIAFIGDPVPEYALALTPLALLMPKIFKSFQTGTLTQDFVNIVQKILLFLKGFPLVYLDKVKRKLKKIKKLFKKGATDEGG